MTRPFFSKDRITNFDILDRCSDVVISKLKERFAQGEPIDFQVCTLITFFCPSSNSSHTGHHGKVHIIRILLAVRLLLIVA